MKVEFELEPFGDHIKNVIQISVPSMGYGSDSCAHGFIYWDANGLYRFSPHSNHDLGLYEKLTFDDLCVLIKLWLRKGGVDIIE
jgi:hypothetical protein